MADVRRAGIWDAVVVGSGHAAVEAALAVARMGLEAVAVTLDPDNIAGMPCNPAVGGPGKAQIVSEIDALGGEMALASDEATIEMRLLNSSKGPAVQSLRAQVDKQVYSSHMKEALREAGVSLVAGMATDVLLRDGRAAGVRLSDGAEIRGRAVILCTGVYLESRIIVGEIVRESGPMGEPNARGLSASLTRLGLSLGRFKTGTSPRIARSSVKWGELRREEGASTPLAFSFMSEPGVWDYEACYSTYTTPETHEIIRRNKDRAPLFNGTIQGRGPRYCPSIEDKVIRFPERRRHQIYLEMEARDSREVYVLGLSTSLPVDVQVEIVRSIPGLSEARLTKPGYAIEYDYLLPSQLKPTLEVADVPGLFAAGQINGTSGYEEAAAQGLVAGVNAACGMLGREPLALGRDEAYTGVLIDDLVNTAVEEPYRMLTSRAEYRLLLRQSNADQRLTPAGRQVGLVSDERWRRFSEKVALMEKGRDLLDGICSGEKVRDLLRDPRLGMVDFLEKVPGLGDLPAGILSELEVEAKYAGFIARQEREANRLGRYSARKIPGYLDFTSVPGLSTEAKERLRRYCPATIGRALGAGISPSDALVLLAFLKEGRAPGATPGGASA
jgi:tRNA uridine 5-carboxymethylaminomethyl modification enzyme